MADLEVPAADEEVYLLLLLLLKMLQRLIDFVQLTVAASLYCYLGQAQGC